MSYNVEGTRVASNVLKNATRRSLLYELSRTELSGVYTDTLPANASGAGFPLNGFNLSGRSQKAVVVSSTTAATVKLQMRCSTEDAWATIKDPYADEDLSWTVSANGNAVIPIPGAGVYYRIWVSNAAETDITVNFVGGP